MEKDQQEKKDELPSQEKILQAGEKLGISREELLRVPPYSALKLLKRQYQKLAATERHKKRHRDRKIEKTEKNDRSEKSSQWPLLNSSQKSIAKTIGNNQSSVITQFQSSNNNEITTMNDEEELLVDMTHLSDTANPTDENFKRYQFLAFVKHELLERIKKNSTVLATRKNKLEPDDIAIFERDIKLAQQQLEAVVIEIKEIYAWFMQTQAERKAFYDELSKEVSDNNGNFKNHFQSKVENLTKYIQVLNDETRPAKDGK